MPGFGRSGGAYKPLAFTVGLVILLIGGWLAFVRLSAKFNDRYESFYPSQPEAIKSGGTTPGWIPDEFLPRSSHSIHEVHELSPSTEWCGFEFVSSDSQNVTKNLKPIGELPPAVRRVPRPGVSWWPPVLEGDLDIEKIHKAGFDLYFAERPATSVSKAVWVFAIDWSDGRGFFFSRTLI